MTLEGNAGPKRTASRQSARAETGGLPSFRRASSRDWFALAFGVVLGLTLIKFGNPVILETSIDRPSSLRELWEYSWPPVWSFWVLLPLVLVGAWMAWRQKPAWPAARWLWVLPVIWFAWQLVSATRSVDSELTRITLFQFTACTACYFLGVWLLAGRRMMQLLLVGLLAAFALCLVRAANQRLFEFPREREFLIENDRTSWTNVSSSLLLDLKRNRVVISTNGMDIANPVILAKYAKGRVHGTLVYPNALAGAVLLLFPVSVFLAFKGTERFRKITRVTAVALTLFLGLGGLFWTGSKSGWLIALGVCCVFLFQLQWSRRVKWLVLSCVLVGGLVVFGVRFKSYFAAGATSVGARFDYWRAAWENTLNHPFVGSGPGTFQRPYARIKAPDAEMARLVHNDFLEQFSDSGVPGGLAYVGWIVGLLIVLGKRTCSTPDLIFRGAFLGLLGWFVQGLSEFSLFVPALAWPAFTLAGALLGSTANQIDKAGERRYAPGR